MYVILIWEYHEVVKRVSGTYGTKAEAEKYILEMGWASVAEIHELHYDFTPESSRN